MTLVLSLIARRWAMQASDRRVVSLDRDGNILRHDDHRNKAVFVAERATFSYTGHADIGGDTAEFFQGQVAMALGAGTDLEDAIRGVGAMTADYLESLKPDTDRHHAYVGVGWSDAPAVEDRKPFILCLSNSVEADGTWLDEPRDTFELYRAALPDAVDRMSLFAAGVPLSPEVLTALSAEALYLCDQSDDPAPLARLLIRTIREEAQRNEAVGAGVMVNCLPISPGPPGGDIMFIGRMPTLDVRTFTYVARDGFDGTYLAPLVAGSDGSRLSGGMAVGADIEPEDSHSGFLYRPASAGPRPRAAVGQRVREYKIGRNDPCWCGSGKKFKNCHLP